MILRLAVCPSFEDGFAVEIARRTQANPNYVIRTKDLSRPSFVSAGQLEGLFWGEILTHNDAASIPEFVCPALTPAEAAPIPELVRNVRVGIPSYEEEWITFDGTFTSLSITSSGLTLALEWNLEPPLEWRGIRELAAHLSSLYPLYRRQMTNDRSA